MSSAGHPPDNDNDDDAKYAQREAFIRTQLQVKNLIPHLEDMARQRGFTENPANAVTYVVGEFARDETIYQAAVGGAYEPEQYSLMADIILSKLQAQASKHKPPRDDTPGRKA